MVVVQTSGALRRLMGDYVANVQTVGVDDRVRFNEGDIRHFADLYASQPALRTVLGFRARNLAMLPIQVLREKNPDDFEVVKDNPLAKLLRRPVPVPGTPYTWIYNLVMDLSMFDRYLAIKVYVEGAGIRLVRVPPTDFQVMGDQWHIDHFMIMRGGRMLKLYLEDVLYLEGYTPQRNYGGVPPMQTLANTIAEEQSSSRYRSALWKNGARLEHVITRPLEAKRMTPDAKDRFWQRWNARYSGTINAARTAMLEEGMDVKTLDSHTPRDAQYIEGRKFNLEEMARLFYIPPAALGILDGASYANMTAQHRQLYRETFGPDITYLEQALMAQLGPEDLSDTLRLNFDLGSKIEASIEELAPALQSMSGGPVLTPNEARKYVKKPALPGQDELRDVSGTIDPAAEGDEGDAADGNTPDNSEDPPQTLGTVTPVRQQRGTGNPSVYRQLERGA